MRVKTPFVTVTVFRYRSFFAFFSVTGNGDGNGNEMGGIAI